MTPDDRSNRLNLVIDITSDGRNPLVRTGLAVAARCVPVEPPNGVLFTPGSGKTCARRGKATDRRGQGGAPPWIYPKWCNHGNSAGRVEKPTRRTTRSGCGFAAAGQVTLVAGATTQVTSAGTTREVPMPELRVVAVSNDGTRLVLKAADGTEYMLPIDERLRAAVR